MFHLPDRLPKAGRIIKKTQIGVYRAEWSAKREPPLCKGRCQKSLIFDGGVVNMINYNNPSVSFADSSLYTREPLGAPAPQQRNDKL